MEFITLNNGVKMPAEGIGTFLLTPDEAETAVLSALKDGARLIDTANAYCNEKAVGRAMKKSGLLREEISSKPSCGRPSTPMPMLWTRRWHVWTPTTSTCCSFTSLPVITLPVIA